ncbi:MAG: radical SAM protein [Candidatus Muirbacterium halophilum]|nr:radical SAM protein [Candidatus Muirbacterium halophilum]MCK9476417.1 radical SAM protein [Candidatus Muirbacterium halophilum]
MKTKKKILLLNPPFNRSVQRDYYCSHTTKSSYLWQPLDLQILSGFLKEYNIILYDCIYNKHHKHKALSNIKNLSPDIIISQTASASLNSDFDFLKKISIICKSKIIVTGDIVRSNFKEILNKHNFINACITNICHNNIKDYIENNNIVNLFNIITRNSANIEEIPSIFSIPKPKISLFNKKNYNLPYTYKSPIYTTLTTYGCPFACKYCHFENINPSLRNPSNFALELKNIKKFNFQYIHFRDQTFGYNKEHLTEIAQIIKKTNLPYTIYSRADVMDFKTLKMLKKSGLHTIEVGVESGSFSTRSKYGKIIQNQTYIDFFDNCRKLKINTVGIFIIGFKEENLTHIKKTETFIHKLKPDYLSLNILIPKHGTTIENKNSSKIDLDPTKGLITQKKLQKIQSNIMHEFYLSPKYIFNKIKNLENLQDFLHLYKNATSINK